MENKTGEKYIQFLAERNYDKLSGLFHKDVTARLLLPRGVFTFDTSDSLVSKMSTWFADSDPFELADSSITALGEKLGVRYKFKGSKNGENYFLEQQTYSKIVDGKIQSFDLICSGFQNRGLT